MSGRVTRWPPDRVEAAKRLVQSLGSVQAAADKLGMTDAALRGMFRFHRIPAGDLIKPPEIPAINTTAPAWQGYSPRKGYKPAKNAPDTQSKPAEVKRVAVVSDVHVPYHDRKAWACTLGIVREYQPHRVVLLGDFMDTESVSRHPKSQPDVIRLAEEYHEANLRLDEIQECAPDATWLYIEGNHENRIAKWCNEFGTMDGMLDAAEALYMKPRDEGYHRSSSLLRGMTWVGLERQPYVIDGCGYLHGVFECMHHAAAHAAQLGPSISARHLVYGHMHTFQAATSAAGYEAQAVGWLGDRTQPVFRAYVKGKPKPWAQGILLQEVGAGVVANRPVWISGGRALFGGRLVAA